MTLMKTNCRHCFQIMYVHIGQGFTVQDVVPMERALEPLKTSILYGTKTVAYSGPNVSITFGTNAQLFSIAY